MTRDDILRFADQGDIRNASLIIEEVKDALGSFETLAAEIGIDAPVISLIRSHIKSHTP